MKETHRHVLAMHIYSVMLVRPSLVAVLMISGKETDLFSVFGEHNGEEQVA